MLSYRIEMFDENNMKRKSILVSGESALNDQFVVFVQYLNSNPLWKIKIQSLGE